MYQAIREIRDTFQKNNLKHTIEQKDENWILRAGVQGKSSSYLFLFIKDDDTGNDVAVRIFDFVRYPKDRFDEVYEILNDMQVKYKFIRFSLQDDGNVTVEYDFPVEFSPIGEGAKEIMIRLTKIMDECYPILMKSIWG